jgi:hypothetical protein
MFYITIVRLNLTIIIYCLEKLRSDSWECQNVHYICMFTLRGQSYTNEQTNKMEEKIVYTALENLRKHTGIEGWYYANFKDYLDGEVRLLFNNGEERFTIEVKREIRTHQLEQIRQLAARYKDLLLIADIIFPKIKEELRKMGVGYLDAAGNIFVQTDKNHVWIEGHKIEKTEATKVNRAFTATGLKAVYLFLIDENMVNQPQRTIANEAGIALGNINYIINGLKEHGFLIEKGRKQFQIINKKQLLERWMEAFEEKLKPTLHIGNFRFTKSNDENNWKEITLKPNETYWGGEPAGEIITNYLVPEIFTLFTDETRNNLIKNYRLVPENTGNIKVYKKFWKGQATFNETVVHPLLAYADLMNTGNSRCMETAKMIYDKYFKENI